MRFHLGTFLLGTLFVATPLAAAIGAFDAKEIDIEILTGIDYRRGGALPDEVNKLNGEEILLEGYMALGTIEGATVFELVPEECECGRSKVQHFIEVTLLNGIVTYEPGRIKLTGKLDIGEKEEDGFIVSLYRLEVEQYP
jgi:hypothetical protein